MHAASRLTHLSLLILSLCAVATASGVLLLTGSLNAIAATAIALAVACVPLGLTLVTTLLQPAVDEHLRTAQRSLEQPTDSRAKPATLRRAA